jgi:hypothetical protein
MKKTVLLDPTNPGRATVRILSQSGGGGVYGEVTLSCTATSDGPLVRLGGNEFAWLKDVYGPAAWEWPICDELRQGALDGVRWALDHCSPAVDPRAVAVTIETIRATVVDSTRDSIFYASCHALWSSLRVQGAPEPAYRNGKLVMADE